MALLTVTQMIDEVDRITGRLAVGYTSAGGPIEKYINDAYRQIAQRYRHPEFEAKPPYYFDTVCLQGAGTAAAGTYTFTINSAAIAAQGNNILGSVLAFDDDKLCRMVTGITAGGPPNTITVANMFETAKTAVNVKIFVNRYPLPTDSDGQPAFIIYDLTDVTSRNAIKQKDVRVWDRWNNIVGQVVQYARRKNDIILWPPPYLEDANGNAQPYKMQLRYALRPPYISGAETISPLGEEWQKIIISEAAALVLDDIYENERATMLRENASRMALEMLKSPDEEIEDADAGFRPVRYPWIA